MSTYSWYTLGNWAWVNSARFAGLAQHQFFSGQIMSWVNSVSQLRRAGFYPVGATQCIHAGITEACVTPDVLPVTGINLAPPMMAPKAVKTPEMQRSQMGTGNGSATAPVL